jgi:hypothetical protein
MPLGGPAADAAEPAELVDSEEGVKPDAANDDTHEEAAASPHAAAPPPEAIPPAAPQPPAPRATTTRPQRPAAVIPLMRAPDDPGPDTEVEEVQQPSGSPSRTPYA